jgi:hypothetical protein
MAQDKTIVSPTLYKVIAKLWAHFDGNFEIESIDSIPEEERKDWIKIKN